MKQHLDEMKTKGLIVEWELPYENLLTRRSAAIFFLSSSDISKLPEVWKQLSRYENFRQRKNEEKKLSKMDYRIEFNIEMI